MLPIAPAAGLIGAPSSFQTGFCGETVSYDTALSELRKLTDGGRRSPFSAPQSHNNICITYITMVHGLHWNTELSLARRVKTLRSCTGACLYKSHRKPIHRVSGDVDFSRPQCLPHLLLPDTTPRRESWIGACCPLATHPSWRRSS